MGCGRSGVGGQTSMHGLGLQGPGISRGSLYGDGANGTSRERMPLGTRGAGAEQS
jgi:hypothetical protein